MSTAATPAPTTTGWAGRWQQGLCYGAPGFPLAFVALPLYVLLPNYYAANFGVPLAWLGAVLLGARLLDAVADPLIGRWVDGLLDRSAARAWAVAVGASGVLALSFHGLFFPADLGSTDALLTWCAALLAITYLSYSVIAIIHQAWGARLGGNEAQRAGIVAWREGLALCGVLVASLLPAVAGLGATTVVFAATLAGGVALLRAAPAPRSRDRLLAPEMVCLPMRTQNFRRLLAVYLLNGIASAVPATLVLFFIRDRLQAAAYEPLFLGLYFAAAGLSVPAWVWSVKRIGLARSWLVGMLLAIAVFAWASLLGANDVTGFALVCLLSGIALGADLSLPAALLAGVIQANGHSGRAEGAYFGWWNFATKLNLALAAGVALPLLQLFGYAPGQRDPDALNALALAYCVLPCLLKLGAAALLWTRWIKKAPV